MSDLSKRRDSCPSSFHNTQRKQLHHNDKYEKDNRRYFSDPFPTANMLFSKENRQANTNKGLHPLYSACRSSFMAKVLSSDRLFCSAAQFPCATCSHCLVTKARKPLTPESQAPLATLPSPPTFYLLVLLTEQRFNSRKNITVQTIKVCHRTFLLKISVCYLKGHFEFQVSLTKKKG